MATSHHSSCHVARTRSIHIDDVEKFTSEMHDPCTRSRCLQERTTQKHLQKGPVWSRPNTLRRLSQKCFYNSRVLERSQSRVPFYEDIGAFYSSEASLFSLQSKSHPCRASLLLVERVSSLQSKSSPCGASLLLVEQVFKDLKLGGQVWAFVLLGAPHKEWVLTSLGPWTWACWARQALSHILSSSITMNCEILVACNH